MPHYGYLLRILSCGISQNITSALGQMELTSAQGHIIGYLAQRQEPACPRDVEEQFRLSHPTVSGLLSRLEKKGFIEMRPDPNDCCKRGGTATVFCSAQFKPMRSALCRVSATRKSGCLPIF